MNLFVLIAGILFAVVLTAAVGVLAILGLPGDAPPQRDSRD